jgi:Ring finger domain
MALSQQQQQRHQEQVENGGGDEFLPVIQEEQTDATDEISRSTETTSSDLLNLNTSALSSSQPEKASSLLVKTALPIISLQTLPPAEPQQPQSQPYQQQQPPQQPILEQGFSVLGVWILACLLVILNIILVVLVVHVIRQRHRIMAIMFPNYAAARRQRQPSRRQAKATLARIERRYETIEGWIVSKRVVAHDEFCEGCVDVFAKAASAAAAANNSKTLDESGATGTTSTDTGPVDKDADAVEFGMHTKEKQLQRLKLLEQQQQQQKNENGDIEQGAGAGIKHLETCDTEDEDDDDDYSSVQQMGRECPICFEEFRVGQVISFSANPECSHVFHHECIKEWLLRHINCPFCRKVCMHVDEYRSNAGAGANCKTKPHVIQELLDKHSKRSATTYYCVKDGLVVIPPKVRCTKRELKQLKHRICDCIVDRQELAKLRGNRQEATVTTNTQAMLREINMTDPTEAVATTSTGISGGGATTVLGIAHGDEGNETTVVSPPGEGGGIDVQQGTTTSDVTNHDVPEQRPADHDVAQPRQQQQQQQPQHRVGGPWLHHHYHETSTSAAASPIALLEMASVADENDYDPTERDDEDDLNVFPQGQLDDASVSEHVTVECDDDDDDDSDDNDDAENGAAHDEHNGPAPCRGGTATVGTSSLSMMMLGRQPDHGNASTRTTGTSTDDDEEMLLQDVDDAGDDINKDNDEDHDECNSVDESHQSNVEEKTGTTTTTTATTTNRIPSADDVTEVTV